MQKQKQHIPVLLEQVVEYLSPQSGESYLDLTAGYGGHAEAIVNATDAEATLVDRDTNAQKALEELFGYNSKVELIHSDFASAASELVADGREYDMVLADLGLSSPHIDNINRGFSFSNEAALDMRMDQTQTLSADTVVNTYSEDKLVQILKEYGEEPKARKIARLIVENRPIHTTVQLADIVKRAWPGHSRVHPATRTFQAIRIEVNDEIAQLKTALPNMIDLLKPGGVLAIISFHSLEDRVVKQYFKQISGDRYDAKVELLTKKVVSADESELVNNPRARSAKLRAVRKRK